MLFRSWQTYAVGTISGWIGLPQHELEIPRLQAQARFWATSALILPFVGAVFVWVGRQKPFDRSDIAGFVFECGFCLAIAILGTLGFLLCLFGLGLLIDKLANLDSAQLGRGTGSNLSGYATYRESASVLPPKQMR